MIIPPKFHLKISVSRSKLMKNSTNTNMKTQNGNNQTTLRVICQIYSNANHSTIKCYTWYDHAYQQDNVPQTLATVNLNENKRNKNLYENSKFYHTWPTQVNLFMQNHTKVRKRYLLVILIVTNHTLDYTFSNMTW